MDASKVFTKDYYDTVSDLTSLETTLKQVDFLKKALHLKRGARILDIPCGNGRHSIQLAKAGFRVTGSDSSSPLLKIAKEEAEAMGVYLELKKGDMRRVKIGKRFDAVINMFTSFGYFDDEGTELFLQNIKRHLKPGGKFLIDCENPARLMRSVFEKGKYNKKKNVFIHKILRRPRPGEIRKLERNFDPIRMNWDVKVYWSSVDDKETIQRYKFRLYRLPELRSILKSNGMRIRNVWGDFDGSPLNNKSARMIVLAENLE
ncbi:MAG TPA: class I SAM-dependent methyltransferase [Candidatus Paceibacterota bacterium]